MSLTAALLAALLTCAALALAPSAARAAEGAISYTDEGLAQYEAQLAGGKIKEVTINKRVRSLRVTLTDGRHVLARYGPKQEPSYLAALRAKGVPVTILASAATKTHAKAKPAHHKLRYIAGGVLVLVIVVVGVVLFVNRRRQAALD